MFILLKNGELAAWPTSRQKLKASFPSSCLVPAEIANFEHVDSDENVWTVVRAATGDEPNKSQGHVVSIAPVLVDGTWTQQWQLTPFTEEELAQQLENKRSGMRVTMRQAQLALHQVGRLSEVEAAINNMVEPEKTLVSIEWRTATHVDRTSPWVSALAAALGLSEADLDSLFELAATL